MADAIIVENISKYYPIKMLDRLVKQNPDENTIINPSRFHQEYGFAALDNVSFHVEAGQGVGLIGSNGAGKSTLLRVLAGITKVSTGRVQVNGRIAALLTLLAGMDIRMTGRENIYLYGALMQFSREEIDKLVPDIIKFSGLGDFIDAPMATYSSGMRTRLAFSSSMYLESDVMLVDEVLAVGDKDFQERALRQMRLYFEKGKTVVLASHNIPAIRSLCQKVIWMDNGQLRGFGETEFILDQYLSRTNTSTVVHSHTEAEIVDITTHNAMGTVRRRFPVGETVHINFKYQGVSSLNDPIFRISIFDFVDDLVIYTVDSKQAAVGSSIPGSGSVMTMLEEVKLLPRQYRIDVSILDRQSDGSEIQVASGTHSFVWFDPAEAEQIRAIYANTDMGGKMIIAPTAR